MSVLVEFLRARTLAASDSTALLFAATFGSIGSAPKYDVLFKSESTAAALAPIAVVPSLPTSLAKGILFNTTVPLLFTTFISFVFTIEAVSAPFEGYVFTEGALFIEEFNLLDAATALVIITCPFSRYIFIFFISSCNYLGNYFIYDNACKSRSRNKEDATFYIFNVFRVSSKFVV